MFLCMGRLSYKLAHYATLSVTHKQTCIFRSAGTLPGNTGVLSVFSPCADRLADWTGSPSGPGSAGTAPDGPASAESRHSSVTRPCCVTAPSPCVSTCRPEDRRPADGVSPPFRFLSDDVLALVAAPGSVRSRPSAGGRRWVTVPGGVYSCPWRVSGVHPSADCVVATWPFSAGQ